MKKIGIATISIKGAYNYGNRMQAYALQEFLRGFGCEAEIIRYEPDYVRTQQLPPKEKIVKKLCSQSFAQSVDDLVRIAGRKIKKSRLAGLNASRIDKFNRFEEKYIKCTDKWYVSDSDYSELVTQYDYFIAGSDQVWNPYYEGASSFYYLDFAPQGKRIAYAPSIAVEEIPDDLRNEIGQWLHGLDHLSIREMAGKQLLQKEFGLNAQLVCDPVFLLPEDKWRSLAVYPKKREKYFVAYILGKKSVKTKQMIKQLRECFQLDCVDIFTRDDPNSQFAGPEEFLGWIANSEFVLTDSFHGMAFAIQFDRPMVILERNAKEKMGSRIDNLLSIVEAGDRSAKRIVAHPEEMACNALNKHRLERFIDESKAYLLSAIGEQKI